MSITLEDAIEAILAKSDKPLTANDIAARMSSTRYELRSGEEAIDPEAIRLRLASMDDSVLHAEHGTYQLVRESLEDKHALLNRMYSSLMEVYRHTGLRHDLLPPALVLTVRLIRTSSELGLHTGLDDENIQSRILGSGSIRWFYDRFSALNDSELIQGGLSTLGSALYELGERHLLDMLFVLTDMPLTLSELSVHEFGTWFTSLLLELDRARGSRGQGSSPIAVAQYIADLSTLIEFETMYDPAGGLGTFPIQVLNAHSERKCDVVTSELVQDQALLARLNSIANGHYDIKIYRRNSLEEAPVGPDWADLIVSHIPFGNKVTSIPAEYLELDWFGHTSNGSLLFLAHILSRLSYRGKAIVLVPEGVLFNHSKYAKSLRHHLLSSRMLRCVISLPAGTLKPYSSVKTSILFLDKTWDRASTVFVDAAATINAQSGAWNFELIKRYLLTAEDDKSRARCVDHAEIAENDTTLTVDRYLNPVLRLYQREYDTDPHLFKLSDVVKVLPRKKHAFDPALPYVTVRDLRSNPLDPPVALSLNDPEVRKPPRESQRVTESAILVSQYFSSLKPSLLHNSDQTVQLGSSVLAVRPDPALVEPEFLVMQLATDEFQAQLASITRGTSVAHFTARDFLDLFVRIPTLPEQRKRVQQAQVTAGVLPPKPERGTESPVRKTENAYQVLSAFKHNAMQRMEWISSSAQVLEQYLERQDRTGAPVSLADPIRKLLPNQEAADVTTVRAALDALRTNIADAIRQMDADLQDLAASRESLEVVEVNVYDYFRQVVIKQYGQDPDFTISMPPKSKLPDAKHWVVKLDKPKFTQAMANLITNARKHAFAGRSKEENRIAFEFFSVSSDVNGPERLVEVGICYFNNGHPMPISFHDYTRPGFKATGSDGSGLGGAYINRIIEMHDGRYQEIDKQDRFAGYTVQHVIYLPVVTG